MRAKLRARRIMYGLRLRANWNWLRGYARSSVLRCRVCGHTVYPGGPCPNVANDGTHAVDGDGWPE